MENLFRLFLFLSTFSISCGFYLIADYYMDPGMGNAFGGVCNKRVEDACLYVSSHYDPFGTFEYDSNVDCIMTLDAGKMAGARFRINWQFFNLEAGDCSKDYLEIYDADMDSISASNLVGRFCGLDGVNLNNTPSDRYLTLKFRTDGSEQKSGFRLKATRYEPPPCQDDEYYCNDTNICIDERLVCDGTLHCYDNSDESDCTFIEELLGGYFALGLGGMVGVGISVLIGCIGCWTAIGVLTCCKKCCKTCCTKCCCFWPCCKKCKPGGGSGKVNPETGSCSDLEMSSREGSPLPAKGDGGPDDISVIEEDNTSLDKHTKISGVGDNGRSNTLCDVE